MLFKMLSKAEKQHVLDLADLMIMADKPLLWGGKTSDELTSDTNLDELTIEESEQDRELMAELENSAGVEREGGGFFGVSTSVMKFHQQRMARYSGGDTETNKDRLHTHIMDRLTKVLKTFPLIKMEKPETRIQAATTVLAELLEDKNYERLTTPRIILFELLLIALRDGHISNTESALIKEFQRYYQLEDFIYDDLLERAEVLNQELSKTIAIILE